MKRWASLSPRQVALLQEIADSNGELSAAWSTVALSVYALRNRGLVELVRSGGAWKPKVAEAGTFYLQRGYHPDHPTKNRDRAKGVEGKVRTTGRAGDDARTSTRTRERSESSISIDGLLARLADGQGSVRIEDPDDETRAAWRRAIHAVKAEGRVPGGYHLRHRGRDRGDLVIELVEGAHPGGRYWTAGTKKGPRIPVGLPEVGGLELHPIAQKLGKDPKRHGVSTGSRQRAERLVHALVTAAEHGGQSVRFDDEDQPGIVIEVQGWPFRITLVEEYETVDRIDLPEESGSTKLYDWQRVQPQPVSEPTGRLMMELADHPWRFRGRRRRWGDTKRWRLDDKLGDVLREIEERADLLTEQRRAEEEERARRQREWEQAMGRARVRFHEEHRRKVLLKQVEAWEESERILRFCDRLEEFADRLTDAREAAVQSWIAWARDYAGRRDPCTWDTLEPDDPEPTPEDLRPYLGRWSPYGPEERYQLSRSW